MIGYQDAQNTVTGVCECIRPCQGEVAGMSLVILKLKVQLSIS